MMRRFYVVAEVIWVIAQWLLTGPSQKSPPTKLDVQMKNYSTKLNP